MDLSDQDAARPCKRICLQSPEPDYADFLWSDSELSPQLTCDNGFSTSISEPRKEEKDEAGLEIIDEALVAESVRHVCLGMIILKATSSFFKGRPESEATVNLQQCGGILKLRTTDTGTYAGILTDLFPSELLDRSSVKLSSLLAAPASLHIIIFSPIEKAKEIGGLLSNHDLFLQHPSPRIIEYFDLDAEYFNPHYLVTPGSRMPQMEDLAIEYNDSTSNESLALDDQKKGQLIGIFDTAANLSIRPTTDPSSRLRTSLKDYQLKALTVMSEKECANVENPQCPSLWVAQDSSTSKHREYRQRITGYWVDVPPICLGGILADLTSLDLKEMGLGKTLCVLSLICWSLDLLRDYEARVHESESSVTLVVIPKSMIPGWQAQIKNHIVPGQIRVALYHGTGRQNLAKQFRNNDIVLTTYQTLRSEWTNKGPLFTESWFRVVLDEAHRIGNRSTQVFQAACELQASRRWCLTGTPIVNSIDNYGALLAFIRMEPLAEKAKFDRWISNPIRDNAQEGLRKLRILVEATCLRRTKSSISQGLPPPTIREEKVDLNPYDRTLYDFFEAEAARSAANSSNHYPVNASETGREKKNVLSLIHNLRRICDHGEDLLSASDTEAWRLYCRLILQNIAVCQSAKTDTQNSIRTNKKPGRVDNPTGEKEALLQAGFLCERIDGQYSIKQRQQSLSRFAGDDRCTVMLATIGSGGEGIDLTSANYVHLLEPHWSPMAEEQAIARVHRIGQQRHVTATKYITPDSIEEYVQSIQVKKTQLIQDAWGANNDSTGNDMEDDTSRKLERWLARRNRI
ncbi:hypothetical protein FGADI_6755 [Fusarium gaditjirri]|uniref:Uncharacterized protein n=1 Tax=Fusarium gaditjirri TaxID=282569 RepID=A0A8H4WWE5_9HYPO|nr:hypothetical protein FGADI_6755 [Fusarium gaditjirri]